MLLPLILAAGVTYAMQPQRRAALSADTLQPVSVNETVTATVSDSTSVDTAKRRNFLGRVLDYFRNSNGTNQNKRFDFGILPGPHFSSTAGLGLGVVATGLYSMERGDTLLPKSNVALYGDMTTKGFLMIGLKGNNFFPKERFRLDYRLYIYTFPTSFWGIGYENGDNDANETSYRRLRFDAMARFLVRIAPKTYVGPIVNFQYVKANSIAPEGLHLFQEQDLNIRTLTAGFSFTYDTRDFILNAKRGWFIQLDQTFTPRFLGNDYCFSTTDLTISSYRKVWRGGVLAGEWHSKFNYGNPAWCLLSEVGSTNRMRGYFEGRYRDKSIMEFQLELRQHVWKRNGIVVWGGLAQIFPKVKAMRWRKVLLNAGIGYRWEFRNGVNVRMDYGFTRNGGGFMFNINEAF